MSKVVGKGRVQCFCFEKRVLAQRGLKNTGLTEVNLTWTC